MELQETMTKKEIRELILSNNIEYADVICVPGSHGCWNGGYHYRLLVNQEDLELDPFEDLVASFDADSLYREIIKGRFFTEEIYSLYERELKTKEVGLLDLLLNEL